MYALSSLAERVGGRVQGDPDTLIHSLATLHSAGPGQLSFFANARYLAQLKSSRAEAVLVQEAHLADVPGHAIVVADPYLAFARLSALFDWRQPVVGAIADSARVAASASVDPSARIEAGAVIGEEVQIGARVSIGANTVVGAGCRIGADSRLEANVTLYPDVSLGERVLVHSGAVLGADGFGFAHDAGSGEWVKICQLGGVVIEDDVEIGAGHDHRSWCAGGNPY